jgi:hypothetical protein
MSNLRKAVINQMGGLEIFKQSFNDVVRNGVTADFLVLFITTTQPHFLNVTAVQYWHTLTPYVTTSAKTA